MVLPQYQESSIRILKGLEPVKQRPGMYTRTDSPIHIVQEILDNAADEALSGFGKFLHVTIHRDDSISVVDEGRGIPLGLHPEEQISVLELVFTRLHAGGKFEKGNGGAYRFSGGLHGVGVSVSNALSKRLEVIVYRDKQVGRIVFSGGDVVEPLTLEPSVLPKRKHGTSVRIWPDEKFFDSAVIPVAEFERLLRSKAVLLKGITVRLTYEKTGETKQWQFSHGLQSYLDESLRGQDLIAPLFVEDIEVDHTQIEGFSSGEGAAWALAFTSEGPVFRQSFVNLIPTPAGGTHESGLREGVFTAVKSFCEIHALLPKGVRLLPEDVFSRLSFVISAKILDPQFQGQIKERLNNRDAVKLISGLLKPSFELWLNHHLEVGKRIAELAIRQAQIRTREGQKIQKKKSSTVAILPGKLTDCESNELNRNELFLVEGDSAGGSAKMGRDKEFQAVLPLRGKVLNTWEAQQDRLFANQEIHNIAVAVGVDPHISLESADLSGLRYGKICILSDADVDGSHIQVLLLSLFYKHFPALIHKMHLYIARPPLFRVDISAFRKRPARKIYCLDNTELQTIVEILKKEGFSAHQIQISRFKGLGEMNAEQLWETTLNPDTRRLLPVSLGHLDVAETNHLITLLMGKNEAAARRKWLEEKGNLVEVDI